jgi:hypothetical protein
VPLERSAVPMTPPLTMRIAASSLPPFEVRFDLRSTFTVMPSMRDPTGREKP